MKTVMGIINLLESERSIKELTVGRPLATVPFAGRYRLIDFALSSMVNSGIINVGILLPNKSRSVMDHVRSGKGWDLARKRDGLRYLPPLETVDGIRNGDIQSLNYHMDYFERCNEQYVLMAGGSVIYNINYDEVQRFHQNTNADITLVYTNTRENTHTGGSTILKEQTDCSGIVLKTAENGLVTDMAQVPTVSEDSKLFTGIIFMHKKTFIDIVRNAHARGGTNFLFDGILRNFDQYNVYGYCHEGYVAHINSLLNYYRASMGLLEDSTWQDLFRSDQLIYTKVKDEAPVKYKKDAKVSNSMIANGCIIEGTVENSILFRGVNVGKGVHVKNSIIMQKGSLGEGVILENVICDKDVVITDGKCLKGAENYPLVVGKGAVI